MNCQYFFHGKFITFLEGQLIFPTSISFLRLGVASMSKGASQKQLQYTVINFHILPYQDVQTI